jgi:hypothetical protein
MLSDNAQHNFFSVFENCSVFSRMSVERIFRNEIWKQIDFRQEKVSSVFLL